jgi:hypothetical protein
MPTIAWFYGILVQMHYDDHVPPHFHARYGEFRAMIRISDGTIIAGELPATAARLVRHWALARSAELQDNWQRAVVHQNLEKIPGPDDDE